MKYLKYLTMTLLLTFVSSTWADSVDISIIPDKPVMNEPFKVIFKIETNSTQAPSISFNPYNVEVLGRERSGVSTRTTFINGRLKVSREVTYVYELTAGRSGTGRLDDIEIEIENKVVKHKRIRFNILRKALASKKYFVLPVVNKKRVFVGESIMVDYYVYSKSPIKDVQVRKYPKLKSFLKRFMQKPMRIERIKHDGEMYQRVVAYSAQLFPDKAGKLYIDPIRIHFRYSKKGNDPFGGFGFGFAQLRSKTLSSTKVQIEVMTLPGDIPKDYTGLVGNHQFMLKVGKSKYLVNEPIEIQLNVVGPGALENFESPSVIKNSNFEEFEANADLKLNQTEVATKIFNYTYLGRTKFNEKKHFITFSTFDPNTQSFKRQSVEFPALKIMGGNFSYSNRVETQLPSSHASDELAVRKKIDRSLVAPIFQESTNISNYIAIINKVLLSLVILLIIFNLYSYKFYFMKRTQYEIAANRILQKGFNYKDLYYLVSQVDDSSDSMSDKIVKSKMTDKSKVYFKEALLRLENKSFSSVKANNSLKVNKKYIGELVEMVKKQHV